jgi:glycerol-3-phosphate dehydrogenase (NAD(P)+)
LAQVAASGGEQVRLWAREPEVVESINTRHENSLFLPGVRLSEGVRAGGDLGWLGEVGTILVVVPTQFIRAVLGNLPRRGQTLILCAKGIEADSLRFPADIARETIDGSPIGVLSGPTFAHEVASGLPTAVTVAATDIALARELSALLARPTFRTYASSDVIGAEIGGAVKNVLAIACGVVEGMGLGLNARAALISRGFAEMSRFGMALGARPETLVGLAGLGDLVLTCTSTNSRNFSLGKGIGEGARAADLLADRRTVAEGAFTAPVLRRVANQHGVEMPIVEAVCALLDGSASGRNAVEMLLSRPLRAEGI